ncbi:MAG: FHA domain-containing protein [Burkholderiaceae bacterium]|nr:FHA domain-containing protein [Burkholderiaceae bacterium]
MAKLILSFDGTMLKTVELNKERTTIGRRPDNDIQVDNLAVSGLHAAVTTVLNDSVIEDLNSTNGTLVNGELTQKHLLKHGDVIEIGKHTIKYVVEATTATPFQDFAKTMVIRRPDAAARQAPGEHASTPSPAPAPAPVQMPPRAPAPQPAAAAPPPAAEPSQPRTAGLQILSGSSAGRVLDLNKSLTTIGKAGVQVAVFTRRPVGFFVTHVEGDVFPLINGEPLGTQARQLNDQDTIEIAGTKMSFFYK